MQLCAPFLCIPTFKLSCKNLLTSDEKEADQVTEQATGPEQLSQLTFVTCILHSCACFLLRMYNVYVNIIYKSSCK